MLALFFGSILLIIISGGCGGGGGEGTGTSDDPNDTTPLTSKDMAIILSPEIRNNGTSSEDHFPISGSVTIMKEGVIPSEVSWELLVDDFVLNEGNFTVEASGNWSGTVELLPGDNHVKLYIPETEVEEHILVTYNLGYVFDGALQLSPDVAYVNEDRLIKGTISLSDIKTDPENVNLVRVDDPDFVVNMKDDGACANGSCPNNASGDLIAGDNIYTGVAQRGRVEQRLKEHLPGGIDAIRGAKKVQIQQKSTIKEATQSESRIIQRSKPRFNKKGK